MMCFSVMYIIGYFLLHYFCYDLFDGSQKKHWHFICILKSIYAGYDKNLQINTCMIMAMKLRLQDNRHFF